MIRFLQNVVIILLLACLTTVILYTAELVDPGIVMYALGVTTGVFGTLWWIVESSHKVVVKALEGLLLSHSVGGKAYLGPVRNRSETKLLTSSSFFCRVSPAKVMNFDEKVKRRPEKFDFYIKSGSVNPGTALDIVPTIERNWLYSLSDEEIMAWLSHVDRNLNQPFIRLALNELKCRARLDRIASNRKIYCVG